MYRHFQLVFFPPLLNSTIFVHHFIRNYYAQIVYSVILDEHKTLSLHQRDTLDWDVYIFCSDSKRPYNLFCWKQYKLFQARLRLVQQPIKILKPITMLSLSLSSLCYLQIRYVILIISQKTLNTFCTKLGLLFNPKSFQIICRVKSSYFLSNKNENSICERPWIKRRYSGSWKFNTLKAVLPVIETNDWNVVNATSFINIKRIISY